MTGMPDESGEPHWPLVCKSQNMWEPLANLIHRCNEGIYRRAIDRALALQLRGEVRKDGLRLRKLSTRLEIEWQARDVHPWERHDAPGRRKMLFVQQALADTNAAIGRLFQALPEVDVIDLKVLEHNSENVIMAGTVERSEAPPNTGLSDGMRLWQRGVTYHSDGCMFEPL